MGFRGLKIAIINFANNFDFLTKYLFVEILLLINIFRLIFRFNINFKVYFKATLTCASTTYPNTHLPENDFPEISFPRKSFACINWGFRLGSVQNGIPNEVFAQ